MLQQPHLILRLHMHFQRPLPFQRPRLRYLRLPLVAVSNSSKCFREDLARSCWAADVQACPKDVAVNLPRQRHSQECSFTPAFRASSQEPQLTGIVPKAEE